MPAIATHYEIRWRLQSSSGAWKTKTVPVSTEAIPLAGLERGKSYEAEARSLSAAGTPSDWVPVTFTVDDPSLLPRVPTGLTVLGVADGVSLKWVVDAEQPADVDYCIERADAAGGPWSEFTRVRALQYTYPVKDSVARWYRVRAVSFGLVYSDYSDAANASGVDVSAIALPSPNAIINTSAYSDVSSWSVSGGTLSQGADVDTTFFQSSGATGTTRTHEARNTFGGAMAWEPGNHCWAADILIDPAVAGSVYIDVICLASDGTTGLLDSDNTTAVKDGAWHRYSCPFVAPAGTAFIKPRVVAQAATWATGQIRWRRCKLEKSASMTPFTEDTSNRVSLISALNAIASAASAQSTADGKINSYYEPTPPPIGVGGASSGDLWFDTSDSNKIHTVVGGIWTATPDSRIALALLDAATAQATADGKVTTYYQITTPTATAIGDMWYNKNNMTFKRWNGAAWGDVLSQSASVNGANLAPNPTFQENTVAAATATNIAAGNILCDGWIMTIMTATGSSGSQRATTGVLLTQVGDGGIANGTAGTVQIRTLKPIPIEPNAKYIVTVGATAAFNGPTPPAGVVANNRVHIQWLDSTGGVVSTSSSTYARGVVIPATGVEVTAPATARACYIFFDTNVANTSGSTYTHGSTVILNASWRSVSLIRKTDLDTFIDDGTNYGRLSSLDLYGSGGFNRLGLRFGASGQRLGSQRNMLQLTTQNVRSSTALSANSAGAVTVNAHSVRYGSFSVSYSAVSSAVTGLTQGVTYMIYCVDDSYSGGAKTWLATINPDALYQLGDGIYFAGQITIPTSGSSSGGGGGGGTLPGDWCVLADSFLPDGRLAGGAGVGTMLPCYNNRPESPNIHHLPIEKNETALAECVVLVTANGAWVGASTCTPMTLQDGRCVPITEMMNRRALVYRLDGSFEWEEVTGIFEIGVHLVAKLVVHQQCYPAGGTMGAFVFTHNIINQKP